MRQSESLRERERERERVIQFDMIQKLVRDSSKMETEMEIK